MWTEVGSCLNIASQLIDTRLKWIKEFSIKMLTKIEGGTAQSRNEMSFFFFVFKLLCSENNF